MREKTESQGRSAKGLDTALYASWYQLGEPILDSDGKRKPFTGNADQISADATAYAAAGLNHLIIGFESDDLGVWLDRMEQFASRVMPLAGR